MLSLYRVSTDALISKRTVSLKIQAGERVSKKWSYRKFPNHPQPQHHHSCNTLLMKKVKLSSGKVLLRPHRYKSVIESLLSEKAFKKNVNCGGKETRKEFWQMCMMDKSGGIFFIMMLYRF